MNKKQKKMLVRICITSAMLILLAVIPTEGIIRLIAYLAAYLIIGYDILRKAAIGVIHLRPFDESFLMTVASLGAFALAIFTRSGDYLEGIAVMLLYQIGELFQSYAVGKSRRSIGALMDIRPDYASIEREGGELEQVDPDSVPIGSIIVVQPGEKIPIDGVVIDGVSSLDTAALTGESVPRTVRAGESVVSGCISMSGVLRIRTEKEFGESTVSRILDLVENASSRKSRSEDLISRFARIYTPAVCICALALALAVPTARVILGLDGEWLVWLYRALTFLVVSCPCALVISVPLSFFAGIGGASREGVLIKGSNYLEALSSIRGIVFDKTGTLTRGTFEVSAVHPKGMDSASLLEYATLAECASSHPIALSLIRAVGGEVDRSRVSDIEEISGHGIIATVDGKRVAVGNGRLMSRIGSDFAGGSASGTLIHVSIDGVYAGSILISDEVKPTSAEAISALKSIGIRRTVMLTGDNASVASEVAGVLGVDEYRTELLPSDKVACLEELMGADDGKLAFVGDGINDAPVLMRADVGIAMGAMGSDAAIEAADVVLMNDDPMQLVKAIRISRKCIRIVKENVIFSLAVKLACLILSALGIASMWLAIFADVGVMIIAVLNAIRALNTSKI